MKRLIGVLLVVYCFCITIPAFASGTPQKEWTFMVFLNADNNLDAFGVADLEKMVAGGGSNDFRDVVVLLDRAEAPTKLYHVEPHGARILKEYGDLDMGDYKILTNFIIETAKSFPAKHYCVTLWNHGSGWKKIDDEIIKGISYDDSSGNHITTAQLRMAGTKVEKELGKKIDVFCFDACLMQMVEVAYSLKDSVDYLVASEEVEPGGGYPYDLILKNFKANTSPKDLSTLIVKEYAKAYNNGSQGYYSTTQSALRTDKMGELIDGINGFAKAAMSENYAADFKHAINNVQKFYYRTNIDLAHFVQLTSSYIDSEPFQNASKKLLKAIDEVVVINGLSGHNTQNAHGIAIYLPASSYSFSNNYKDLDFAKNTLWEQMAKDYYKKSTSTVLMKQVVGGDFSGIREYIKTANLNNEEVTHDLITRFKFSMFSEEKFDYITQQTLLSYLKQLEKKQLQNNRATK